MLLLPQPGLRRGRESALENAHERPGRRAAGAHRRGVLRRENALEGGKEWLKSRYGAQGICRIQQIEEKSIGASRRLYYVLKPVYHEDSTIFVPVDNPALTGKMHRLLRAQEVLELLSGLAGDDGLWVEDEAQRREAYEQILRSGDRVGMARLIRALSLQKVRLGAQHKKLHAAEEAILKEAERELNEEFAYVLGLSLEETPAFIRNLIETDEESEEAFAAHLKEKN